jgi:hypothetical protein
MDPRFPARSTNHLVPYSTSSPVGRRTGRLCSGRNWQSTSVTMPLNRMTGTRCEAEVCKSVQLSSGSADYPAGYDVLCLLRPASHDANRLEPRTSLPRARPGVLDRAPGVRQGPLRPLCEAGAVVHLSVVRWAERARSASHLGRRFVAERRRPHPDSPRLVTPIARCRVDGQALGTGDPCADNGGHTKPLSTD